MPVFHSANAVVLPCMAFVAPVVIGAFYWALPGKDPRVLRSDTTSTAVFYACVFLGVFLAAMARATMPDINLWRPYWWQAGGRPSIDAHTIGWLYLVYGVPAALPWLFAIACWDQRRIPRQLVWLAWSGVTIAWCVVWQTGPPSV